MHFFTARPGTEAPILQAPHLKLQKDGTGYAILHTFGASGDGRYPADALLEASDGMLYGATCYGGTNGQGALYRLNKDGSGYAIVRSFRLSVEGIVPVGALIEDSNGALYGATYGG